MCGLQDQHEGGAAREREPQPKLTLKINKKKALTDEERKRLGTPSP